MGGQYYFQLKMSAKIDEIYEFLGITVNKSIQNFQPAWNMRAVDRNLKSSPRSSLMKEVESVIKLSLLIKKVRVNKSLLPVCSALIGLSHNVLFVIHHHFDNIHAFHIFNLYYSLHHSDSLLL